jgi:hypothetical protein
VTACSLACDRELVEAACEDSTDVLDELWEIAAGLAEHLEIALWFHDPSVGILAGDELFITPTEGEGLRPARGFSVPFEEWKEGDGARHGRPTYGRVLGVSRKRPGLLPRSARSFGGREPPSLHTA